MKRIYLNTLTPEEIIKRLKNGGVIKLGKTGALSIKMIDGVIVTKEKTTDNFTIGDKFYIDGREDYYFEEPEEFNIKKIGLYKTRNGKIAFVSFVGKENIYGIVEGFQTDFHWYKDGSHLMFKKDDFDLVEYVGRLKDAHNESRRTRRTIYFN